MSKAGPVIDVLVGVSTHKGEVLRHEGQIVPTPVLVRGLIDTGANCTLIDPLVVEDLKLEQKGITKIHTPSTGDVAHDCSTYDISLTIQHMDGNVTFGAVTVAEARLERQGIQALIGRDILKNCIFIYDGSAMKFTLAF